MEWYIKTLSYLRGLINNETMDKVLARLKTLTTEMLNTKDVEGDAYRKLQVELKSIQELIKAWKLTEGMDIEGSGDGTKRQSNGTWS